MADFSWSLDAPSGTFKNHALSNKIRTAAVADSKFMQFVDVEPNYSRGRGDTVTITRVKNLTEPTSGKFGERERVPVDTFSLSTTSITVSYWGRGIN